MRTEQQQTNKIEISELNYPGNIGVMEVVQFYMKAKEDNKFKLIDKVNELIKNKHTQQAWKIIQDYMGVNLSGKDKTL